MPRSLVAAQRSGEQLHRFSWSARDEDRNFGGRRHQTNLRRPQGWPAGVRQVPGSSQPSRRRPTSTTATVPLVAAVQDVPPESSIPRRGSPRRSDGQPISSSAGCCRPQPAWTPSSVGPLDGAGGAARPPLTRTSQTGLGGGYFALSA